MIINGAGLLFAKPIKNMLDHKVKGTCASHGLSEVGYDIRLKQSLYFWPQAENATSPEVTLIDENQDSSYVEGNFTLASAIEEFDMPPNLVGIVHDKSTWARHGVSVFNTVIEPGWKGFLTLELVFNGRGELHIPAGTGIAQVIFHQVSQLAQYEGKYQNQADKPVSSKFT